MPFTTALALALARVSRPRVPRAHAVPRRLLPAERGLGGGALARVQGSLRPGRSLSGRVPAPSACARRLAARSAHRAAGDHGDGRVGGERLLHGDLPRRARGDSARALRCGGARGRRLVAALRPHHAAAAAAHAAVRARGQHHPEPADLRRGLRHDARRAAAPHDHRRLLPLRAGVLSLPSGLRERGRLSAVRRDAGHRAPADALAQARGSGQANDPRARAHHAGAMAACPVLLTMCSVRVDDLPLGAAACRRARCRSTRFRHAGFTSTHYFGLFREAAFAALRAEPRDRGGVRGGCQRAHGRRSWATRWRAVERWPRAA